MINIELDATYDGMSSSEAYQAFVKPMQDMGASDEFINEMLQEHKDGDEDETKVDADIR